MTAETFKNYAEGIEAIASSLAIAVGSIWALYRFILRKERFPHIQSSADIVPIGYQNGYWVVELICTLTNKGVARHQMSNIEFDLSALYDDDEMQEAARHGEQLFFPRLIKKGSFKPVAYSKFFIDSSVEAKYSYVARVPAAVRFLILHCWFQYDDQDAHHATERTIELPPVPQ